MRTMSEVASSLRRKNMGQYVLLVMCCFFSVLLITAYVTMMKSPTVLSILPEGGDSRKQVMMIFVMAVIGCGMFTTYASGLFFRYKSREVGVFMALGASKKLIRCMLEKELLVITVSSCFFGALLGVPLAFLMWQFFRMFIVDSEEMRFVFEAEVYGFALAFSVFVFFMVFGMLRAFLRRSNVLDVVNTSRKSEVFSLVPRYYGVLGVVLIVVGLVLGYMMPSFFVLKLNWYSPDWLAIVFYAPAIIGLYWVLLYTVVYGWSRKNPYKNLISSSIMRFQGRQSVRNMIVVTLLVAGAFFGSFYTPLMATSSSYSFDARDDDFMFRYRKDQDMIRENEIRALANKMEVRVSDYCEANLAVLGVDGYDHVESKEWFGVTYEEIYSEFVESDLFISESEYSYLTGDKVLLGKGEITTVFSDDNRGEGRTGNETTLVTNPLTKQVLRVRPIDATRQNTMLLGWKILDDDDYKSITAGLDEKWQQRVVIFNVENEQESYFFAKQLFHEIVNRSSQDVATFMLWDPVEKIIENERGNEYFYDSQMLDYSLMDSSEFRIYWEYMPQFRILDKTEFARTTAVFLMLFIFIAILCFSAVGVILYTRGMTIAMNNKQVYSDLGKLGASKTYLKRLVKSQLSKVFFVPIFIGTTVIALFYGMILYFNDGFLSKAEILSAINCSLVIAIVSLLFYGLYRLVLCRVWKLVLSDS